MATNDLTRKLGFFQKKSMCYFAERIEDGVNTTLLVSGDSELVVNLPPDCFLIDAYVLVETAATGTTSQVRLGTAAGGAQIMALTSVKATGKFGSLVAALHTGAGMPVYLGAFKAAESTAATYVIVIEYLEYTKKTGEYTSL